MEFMMMMKMILYAGEGKNRWDVEKVERREELGNVL